MMDFPVVVLAGGLATRLRPLTEKIPKSLIEINNIPFVFHQLDLFQYYGIRHVHYCLGYLGEMVKEILDKSHYSHQIKITYSFDGDKLLGTGGAIKKALPELPDSFFITYGDSFLDINYRLIESLFLGTAKEQDGLMTVYKNINHFDASNVIYKNDRIILYSKKETDFKMEYIDYGLGILRKRHFQKYQDNYPFDLSEIYETLSKRGNLIGYESLTRFYEIGSIQGIKDLSIHLKTK